MNRYEPGNPRAIVGFAAVFMTAATLAVSVIAPAAMNSTSGEVSVFTTSSAAPATASADAGALTTSIEVVAFRRMRLVPVVHTHVPFRNDLSS